jgi:hypothetical protein
VSGFKNFYLKNIKITIEIHRKNVGYWVRPDSLMRDGSSPSI